jgi:RNA polymerase-binding protein DksA
MSLQHARQRLLTIRAELEARLVRTQKHLHRAEALSPNSHEQAVETGNDAVVQALDGEGKEELQQVLRALRRIDNGSYPYCNACGKTIGEKRLDALPWTDVCIKCA